MDVPEGQKIPLSLQLWDANPDAFVKAVLTAADGSPYVPNTVILTGVGNGLYLNSSLIMPHLGPIFATLFVYADAGFTILDDNYTVGDDVFSVAQSGGGGGGVTINGAPLVGYVVDSPVLMGNVETSQLEGEIENPGSVVTGEIENNQPTGDVESGSPLVGKVEC